MYEFFARYVRKVSSDSDIKTDLRNNEGLLFVDKITPSDIAFVISVLKNGCDVWDQNIKMKQLGVAVHGDRETKKRPLFTGEKAILSCMQFVLHADLILLELSCRFVSGRTLISLNFNYECINFSFI